MDAISHHAGLAIQNAITYQETKQDAHTAVLTALPNRRYFKSFAREELKRASEINYPVTLLMMDLDAFKQVNDQFGHRVGDHVLQEVASLLKAQMRRSDVCARFGGDEFLILLPGVDREGAEHAIERIQTAMENHVIDLESDQRISVGTSIGSATFPDQAVGLSTLVALADRAMYSNKLARERLQKSVSKLSLVDTKRPQAVEKKRSWSA